MDNDLINVHSRAPSATPFRAPGPLITPSASPPIHPSFTSTSTDGPSPTKKRRLLSSTPSLPGPSNADTLAEIDAARRASSMKVLEIWSQLAEKYTRRLDEDDIINLRDETIIKDRGVLSSSGSATWQIGSFADGHHENRGASVQDEEDFDEIDAFYSPSRDYSPSELEDNDVGNDSELKRQSKRIPPVRERDPEDAEDLREFLEAERLRKEMYDEADGEGSTDVDDVDTAELIENNIKDIEEQGTVSDHELSDMAPCLSILKTSKKPQPDSRFRDSFETDSTDNLPLRSYDTSNLGDHYDDMSDEDEFGSWTHDEASAIYEPSTSVNTDRPTPMYVRQTPATPPSSSDYPYATRKNKVLSLEKSSATSKAATRRKTSTSMMPQAGELTPSSRRMNEKFEEMRLNCDKYSQFVREERRPIPVIPYQTPPWSSPSIQDAHPLGKISLIDLTNDTSDEVDILENKVAERDIMTMNKTPKNNNISVSAGKVASRQPSTPKPRRGSSLKPEVVIVQRSWSRLPSNNHIQMAGKRTQQANYDLHLSSRSDGEKQNAGPGSDIDYLSPSASPLPLPRARLSFLKNNQKKMNDSASRKRRRSPSPELYDVTEFDNQDLLSQAESSKSTDPMASPSPHCDSPEPKPYYIFDKTPTLDDRISSRCRSHRPSSSFSYDSIPSSPIPRFGYSVPPSANAANFGREDLSKISHDVNAQYALVQAINSLSYLMRNNPQILPSVPGPLPSSHQIVPWMINANTFGNPSLPHYPQFGLDPHTNHEISGHSSSFDPRRSVSAPSSPNEQYHMRGRSNSRGASSDIRRPKSAMRNASRHRRVKGQRRSVSFTNPEVVSIDGEVYTPMQQLEGNLTDPECNEISNSFSNKRQSSAHEQNAYEENLRFTEQGHFRMHQRKSVRAQTPGPSDKGKDDNLNSGIARYSDDASFKSNALIGQASGKKRTKGAT